MLQAYFYFCRCYEVTLESGITGSGLGQRLFQVSSEEVTIQWRLDLENESGGGFRAVMTANTRGQGGIEQWPEGRLCVKRIALTICYDLFHVKQVEMGF